MIIRIFAPRTYVAITPGATGLWVQVLVAVSRLARTAWVIG